LGITAENPSRIIDYGGEARTSDLIAGTGHPIFWKPIHVIVSPLSKAFLVNASQYRPDHAKHDLFSSFTGRMNSVRSRRCLGCRWSSSPAPASSSHPEILIDAEQRQIEVTRERWYEAEVHRVYGGLLIAAGDPASAKDHFNRAITVACERNAKLWQIRAATSLAGRDRGKRAEARDLLAPVYGWFTEGLDTPVPKEAKALLDELA
jgi:hypothetical protein